MSHSLSSSCRRGMLLLMVMLMLALFMAIGGMLLTIATRARASARARSRSAQQSVTGESIMRQALDDALLAALRGATTGTSGSVFITGPAAENLLADKYGSPTLLTATIASGTSLPVMTLALPTMGSPARLNGLVLTLNPSPAVGDVTSFRILGAVSSGSSTTCYVANLPSTTIRRLPPLGIAVSAVINGREFSPVPGGAMPEEYDAFDDQNLFLAQPLISGSQVARYARASFVGATGMGTLNVDNDNDGVADGAWFPPTASGSTQKVLPDIPSPLGGTLQFQVSYLILDLDGRLNVNTSGMARATGSAYTGSGDGRLGMGYGPADVDISLLLPPSLPSASGVSDFAASGTGAWAPLVLNGVPTLTGSTPSLEQRRTPPLVGTIQGRYGPDGRPGAGSFDDSTGYHAFLSGTNYRTAISGSNTVADLQGRLKMSMGGSLSSPKQIFFSPTAYTATIDSTDDPYELRLDDDAPRWGGPRRPSPTVVGANDDSPFTLGELERMLRPQDTDATQLPQRLAAGFGTYAQASRMRITTDSWDTPGICGTSGTAVASYVANLPVMTPAVWSSGSNSVSADVAAGLRLNLNRPVLSGTTPAARADQQEYCKAIYTVTRALGVPRAAAAQWAANVLDFRDDDNGDSILTRFDYDTDPENGWSAAEFAAPAWGMERPELVFENCTHNPLSGNAEVTLRRPPCEVELSAAGSATSVETIAPSLGTPPYTLVFRSSPPIWRLRLNTGPTHAITDDSSLGPGATKAVAPAGFTVAGAPPATTVFLERLANPAAPFDASANPYVAVDQIAVPAIPGNVTTATVPAWFHWPNRAFISQAELMLVSGTYASRDPIATSLARTTPGILDVTHVPSRFAGHALTVSGSLSNLNLVGLDQFATNQLSKWREPGKVNVNTIVSGTNPAIDADDVVWTTLISGTTLSNPFVSLSGTGATPATSTGMLLSGTSFIDETFGDLRDTNPLMKAGRAIRLANTATVRSQVFAVWITVQVTDTSPNAPSPQTKRLFAIVDRSIPVGYSPNQDLNVRDVIRLKRYLD